MSNPVTRFLGAIWRVLNSLLKLIQILFVLIFVGVLVAALTSRGGVTVPDSGALVISPSGTIVEEFTGEPWERALAEVQGQQATETLLRDVIDSLESAAGDDRIKAVVMKLDQLEGGGLPKLQAIARAVTRVREAGKPVVAVGDAFTQNQYYLAAHADQVLMHDFGVVFIDGYGYYRTYLKSALDKLRVDLNVFRVGEYKSFVEPFIRDDMSAEDKESSQRWLDALWTAYQRDVVAARELPEGTLDAYANGFLDQLRSAGGNTGRLAVRAGLVDELVSRNQAEQKIRDIVGASEDEPDTYDSIDYRAYITTVRIRERLSPGRDQVGVIVASGEIVDGEAPPGTVGGDTLASLISSAAKDEAVKAVVLRVDSPGGSVFASEIVFDEIKKFLASGKPLVGSMSSVAASGGYYIAMPADEIWASANTITGSIGIGAIVPTFQRGLGELGIHVDGIGTTSLAGQLRLDRELGAEARQIIRATIDEGYRIFIGKVAEARGMSVERADSVARGRVWTGADAADLGLVDSLGGLEDAVAAAAERAGLEGGAYDVAYISKALGFRERLAMQFMRAGSRLLAGLGLAPQTYGSRLLRDAGRLIEGELRRLSRLNDPRDLYYHCFCVIP